MRKHIVNNNNNQYDQSKNRRTVDRRTYLAAAGASALAVTAGCLGGGSDRDGIAIGGLFPQPGDFPGGTGMQQATEVLTETLNDDGGLLGEDVELVTRDTELDPATARDGYRELILEEEVDVTTGVYSTEVGTAVLDELSEFETVHMAGGTSHLGPHERLRENYEEYKYWFRGFNGAMFGRSIGNSAREFFADLGIEDIGVATEDIDGFTPIVEGALENIPGSVTVHFEERFASDTTDFGPILDQGESNDIDLLLGFTAQGGSALVTQWAQRQPNYGFGGGDIFSSNPNRWETTNGDVEYVWSYVGGSGPGFETNELTEQFIADHRNRFDGAAPPHAQAYSQYDVVLTWAEAVEEAGTIDTDEVVETIEGITVDGTTGTLDYHDQDGEWPHDPKFGKDLLHPPIMQWQEVDGEGQQVGLFPEKVRTGEYQTPPWVDR